MMRNLTSNALIEQLNAAVATGDTEITSGALEMTDEAGEVFESVTFFVKVATADAGNTVKVVESDDDVTYTDVEGAVVVTDANGDYAVIELYRPASRYFKVVVDRSGADTALSDIWAIKALAREVPVEWTNAKVLLATYPEPAAT